jgi:MFS family permease
MIARLPRSAAIIQALIFAAVTVWCLTVPPAPLVAASAGDYTDVQLYRDIAGAVAQGTPYYQAAAQIQRAHRYPLKPFVTVRPPTLAWWAATAGWRGVQITAMAIALAGLIGWIIGSAGLRPAERAGVVAVVALGCGPLLSPAVLALHECLAGLCLSLALAGVWGWPRQWWWIMVPLALGLAVRELVLPFVLLLLAFALAERRWREVLAWLGLIGVWAGLMAWHAHLVAPLWRPGDEISQGWAMMQGPAAFLLAVVHTSVLAVLPFHLALVAAVLPMVGWLALDGRIGRFSMLLVAGYALLLAGFSRPDTFYWGALMLPWYFVGYALVPRAVGQWLRAIRPVRATAVHA